MTLSHSPGTLVLPTSNKESNVECIDDYGDGTCRGVVDYYDLSGDGRTFPRCEKHLYEAIERVERAMERYPVTAPADFDPDYAGERWDDDY